MARPLLATLVGLLMCISLLLAPLETHAQLDPLVRDQVIRTAVQIAFMADVTEHGVTSPTFIPVGSGTVVSPTGVILTNAHVVDVVAHRAHLRAWETDAADRGEALSLELIEDRLLILWTNGAGPPAPLFLAVVIAQDPDLDLALVQVVETPTGEALDLARLALPALPLGDSDSVQLGDPIDVFAFPAAGGNALTYTAGVVSGFNFAEGSGERMWITTDATLSGGSSGGTAVNRQGELIGVPTQGSLLDCRPGDANQDGEITAEDVGCIPSGGSIGQVRPINVAKELLVRAGVTPTELAVEPDIDLVQPVTPGVPAIVALIPTKKFGASPNRTSPLPLISCSSTSLAPWCRRPMRAPPEP